MSILKYTAVASVVFLAACSSENAADSTLTETDRADATETAQNEETALSTVDAAAENLAKSTAFLKENAEQEGVVVTDSGLQYKVLEKGPDGGATPAASDLVKVHYVGTLINGEEFDSSVARGEPVQFPLDRVIPGWTEGVQLMSEGDKYQFIIPSELGYGEVGTPGGPIGPNEALIFEVELLGVKSPARNLEKSNAFLAQNATKDGIKTTESGLQYEVLQEGAADGASPEAKDKVKVHYAGTLIDGTEFDSSYKRGEPIEFALNRVIPGWTEGVQLMSVGDKYRFFIPPALGYGERGAGANIGPNEALIFEVELLDVK